MENSQSAISKEEYDYFDERLRAETNLLEQWFIDQVFTERELEAGSEIELFLLNKHYEPAPENLQFIEAVSEPFLIPEVGKAHLEINSCHTPLYGDCLRILHKDILTHWQTCCEVAKKRDNHLVLIGSLPTATEAFHQKKYLTDKIRYALIDTCCAQQREGKPIEINVKGYEHLHLYPESLAMNGLISALQFHIQVGLSQSVRYYNTAQAIAGPMLALSCNSPYIFGKHVWEDSRIAIFDQVMTLQRFDRKRGFKSCLFGISYLKDSFFELFDQNYQFFPRLIPEANPDSPLEDMFHVRRQNGIIYRWNRPVIDFNLQGQPHLRIEHRGPSSGPTVIDMIANAAFFYGLINYFAIQPVPLESLLPFHCARKNFFNAARFGLNTEFSWLLGRTVPALELLENLIPLARKGLQILGITAKDIEEYLGVIERRVAAKTNGSIWQCRFIEKNGKDFTKMIQVYIKNQNREIPVSEWKI
ncbi:MAG: hypothetical protein WC785_01275 [Tatlockia sp.]|jgi:gamma-glutamyl:cysteine ligase YbdK (ATP-grasp superfamily)